MYNTWPFRCCNIYSSRPALFSEMAFANHLANLVEAYSLDDSPWADAASSTRVPLTLRVPLAERTAVHEHERRGISYVIASLPYERFEHAYRALGYWFA